MPRDTPSGTRRLTLLYITALSAVALLTIAGQVVVQYSLSRQERNSTVINIAGRQRMLSQKLTKTALLLSRAPESERAALAGEMETIVAQMRESHAALLHGNLKMHLPGRNSAAIQQLFGDLTPQLEELLSTAEQAQRSTAAVDAHVTHMLPLEKTFLTQMDAIVFQYDREAQADVARLRWQERVLLAITLAVLFTEGLLIFRPAVRRIKTTLHDLGIAKQAAEAANQEKSRFLARMSHELRTPLNALLGLTDLLLLTPRPSDERQHLLTMHDAAEALLRLVEDLLDIARVEAGRDLIITPAPCDLREVVQRTTRMFQFTATQHGLELDCDYDEQLPQWLVTDAGRVQQILLNLVQNSLKFTDTGTVHVSARLASRANDVCQVELAVSDSGIGIPLADQERIFESFTQLSHPGRMKQEGVGLGLNIVGRIVAALGGTIRLQSAVNQGSTFTATLPMEVADEATQAKAGSPLSAPHSLHVLVVEDNPANQMVSRELLHSLGHECVLATTAAAGIETAALQDFDVVLLDIELPDGSGYDVAAHLRATDRYRTKPLIAVTAHAAATHQSQATNAGFTSLLTKPLRRAQLAEAIGTWQPESATPDLSRWQDRPELLQSLIRLFHEEWPRLVQSLDAALAEQDARQVQFFAHRIKGLTANFEDAETRAAAELLESAAAREKLSELSRLRTALVQALARLADRLDKSPA